MSTVAKGDVSREGAPKFIPPKVFAGDVVLWYPSGRKDSKPMPAIVSQVNHVGTITAYLMSQGVSKIAVRHVDDPFLATLQSVPAGAWDVGGSHDMVLKAADAIQRFKGAVQELGDGLNALRDEVAKLKANILGPDAKKG